MKRTTHHSSLVTGLDVPGQLLLFPPLGGGEVFSVSFSVDLGGAASDAAMLDRLNRARRRLSRGAVIGRGKARKLACELETIATLFDGAG